MRSDTTKHDDCDVSARTWHAPCTCDNSWRCVFPLASFDGTSFSRGSRAISSAPALPGREVYPCAWLPGWIAVLWRDLIYTYMYVHEPPVVHGRTMVNAPVCKEGSRIELVYSQLLIFEPTNPTAKCVWQHKIHNLTISIVTRPLQ